MSVLKVNFTKETGPVKPMHATNSGPVYKYFPDQRITNIDSFREAGIPYVRVHDSIECIIYGGAHCGDFRALFPDFDRDPYDPASYDFRVTDEYMKVILNGGSEIFFGLAPTIEHLPKKYDIYPPEDYKKWAVVCEHFIRHYNEGWADGYHMNIRYWEIWNEPDLDWPKNENPRTWAGTKQQFFDFFNVVFAHLKSCFPDLKIGGPAIAWRLDWGEEFLAQLPLAPDFFSWHIYTNDIRNVKDHALKIRRLLDQNGFTKTESILNEWNYIRSWKDEGFLKSLFLIKEMHGASFYSAVISLCQYLPVDMLMYYSAAPHILNGMFREDIMSVRLKGYYPFRMFNELYALKESYHVESDDPNLILCAAKDGDSAAILLTYFDEADSAPDKEVRLSIDGFSDPEGIAVTYYLLDKDHDMQPVKKETFSGDTYTLFLNLKQFDTYLIRLVRQN